MLINHNISIGSFLGVHYRDIIDTITTGYIYSVRSNDSPSEQSRIKLIYTMLSFY